MKKKVLLMGRSGSGKTSMRSIIFANYIARDTMRLGATIDVEHSHVRFLGNLVLNLWDCGGQEHFMQSYFESQKAHIFKNVQVLIYVFDIASATDEKDTEYFVSCLEAIHQNSQGAKIFCLIHKIDLVAEDQREAVFRQKQQQLEALSAPFLPGGGEKPTAGAVASISCFMTSIWDATLYAAWSSIVHSLIPNVQLLKGQLECLRQICKADEVVLFERATFLVICSASAERKGVGDAGEGGGSSVAVGSELRFEKVSNIIKQFKLSCARAQAAAAQFDSMEVQNSQFRLFIDLFTSNTYVMVVQPVATAGDSTAIEAAPPPARAARRLFGPTEAEPSAEAKREQHGPSAAATLLNISLARKHFEKLLLPPTGAGSAAGGGDGGGGQETRGGTARTSVSGMGPGVDEGSAIEEQ